MNEDTKHRHYIEDFDPRSSQLFMVALRRRLTLHHGCLDDFEVTAITTYALHGACVDIDVDYVLRGRPYTVDLVLTADFLLAPRKA